MHKVWLALQKHSSKEAYCRLTIRHIYWIVVSKVSKRITFLILSLQESLAMIGNRNGRWWNSLTVDTWVRLQVLSIMLLTEQFEVVHEFFMQELTFPTCPLRTNLSLFISGKPNWGDEELKNLVVSVM